MSIFTERNKQTISQNYSQLVLKSYNIDNFDHKTHYCDYISDNQANLFNKEVKYEISHQEIIEKLERYFDKTNFTTKNWLLEKQLSIQGICAYLIFTYKNKLEFKPVKISSPIYDLYNTLLEVIVEYEPYLKNEIYWQMFEKYELVDKQVKIKRWIQDIDKNKAEFKNNVLNDLLKEEQTLNLDQIPIAIMRNLPSQRSDFQAVINKIKALNIFFDQIILDVVLNSTRFLVNSNGVIASQQEMVNEAIQQFLQNNILITDYDSNTDPLLINTINGEFHGKVLCHEMYDWITNIINKHAGVYVPSLINEIQENKKGTHNINPPLINMIEQKIKQRENDRANFIKLLLKFDKNIMSGTYFGENDIDNLEIKVKLNLL